MPNHFEFYSYVNSIPVVHHIYYISEKGFYMYKKGDCINHFYYPARRISEIEYIIAYEEYKGY